jgi:NADH dehydrogenase
VERLRPTHRIFVTGATGFVGRQVVHAMRAEGYTVRCLVRRGAEAGLRGLEAIERVEGDVLVRDELERAMTGCETAVHLVGIIREQPAHGVTFERVHIEGTENLLAVAASVGVRRLLHMSALGARAGAPARYHRTKWAAEEAVRSSGLAWTIFRPSVIYGRGDGFVSRLAAMVRRLPVVPVLGSGQRKLQPVPIEHVAAGFALALARLVSVKQTFDVAGPDAVSMVELLDAIGAALGRRRVRKVHVPLSPVRRMARALDRVPAFPVTTDQLLMLDEDSTCDPRPFYQTFDLEPIPLAAGLQRLLR